MVSSCACASVEGFLQTGIILPKKKKKQTLLNGNDIYLMSQAAKISDVRL